MMGASLEALVTHLSVVVRLIQVSAVIESLVGGKGTPAKDKKINLLITRLQERLSPHPGQQSPFYVVSNKGESGL